MPDMLNTRVGDVVFQAPFWSELTIGDKKALPHARLPKDVQAHALWYYYMVAANNLRLQRDNLVAEDEISHSFSVAAAHQLIESVAMMYQVTPGQMVRCWEACDAQRMALGYTQNAELPAAYRFRFAFSN